MVKERDQIHEATWVNHHAIASAWLRTRLSFDRIRPSPNLMQGNNLKQYSLRSYLSRYHQAQRLAPAACECNATSVAGLPDHLFHPQLTTPNTRVDHITLKMHRSTSRYIRPHRPSHGSRCSFWLPGSKEPEAEGFSVICRP